MDNSIYNKKGVSYVLTPVIAAILVFTVVIVIMVFGSGALNELIVSFNEKADKDFQDAMKERHLVDREYEEALQDDSDPGLDFDEAKSILFDVFENENNYRNCIAFIPDFSDSEYSYEITKNSRRTIITIIGSQNPQVESFSRKFNLFRPGSKNDGRYMYDLASDIDSDTKNFFLTPSRVDVSNIHYASYFSGKPTYNIRIDGEDYFLMRISGMFASRNLYMIPWIPIYYDSQGDINFFVTDKIIDDLDFSQDISVIYEAGPSSFDIDNADLNLFRDTISREEFDLCDDSGLVDMEGLDISPFIRMSLGTYDNICKAVLNENYCGFIETSKEICAWDEEEGCYMIELDQNSCEDALSEDTCQRLNGTFSDAGFECVWNLDDGTCYTLKDEIKQFIENVQSLTSLEFIDNFGADHKVNSLENGEWCIFVHDSLPVIETGNEHIYINNDGSGCDNVGFNTMLPSGNNLIYAKGNEMKDYFALENRFRIALPWEDEFSFAFTVEGCHHIEKRTFAMQNKVSPANKAGGGNNVAWFEDYFEGSLQGKSLYVIRKESDSYSVSPVPQLWPGIEFSELGPYLENRLCSENQKSFFTSILN
ncbi:MAG: hypothetical protein ACLFPQ_06395 [Candidatus Woesearchaeota archaeon]